MSKLKKIFKNWRIILLIVAIVLSIASINPSFGQEGVAIRNVEKNSSASLAGIESPTASTPPRSREVVLAINNIPVKDEQSYNNILSTLPINQTISVKTDKQSYIMTTGEKINLIQTGETITRKVTEEEFDEELNRTINKTTTIAEPKVIEEKTGEVDIGLTIYNAPTSNIRKGLDLTGGTRVILKPEKKISEDDLELVLENIKQRLNVFGLSDIVVRAASDLTGDSFIIVEIAGATEEEVSDLLARQGKFEAKIANDTVFRGGNDVTYVCRSADCSGIDPRQGCGQTSQNQWFCSFYFQISLNPEAAQRQADATRKLEVITDTTGSYLSEPILLYLDDEEVDSLRIASSLQGSPVTDISITGSGSGISRDYALADALVQMKRLQTILITGSLPVKLGIERTDTISPALGEEFLKNAILMGLFAMIAVVLTVFVRYRRFVVSIPMIITIFSEATIILGIASIIGWNLDLAAIAGIIISIGTGVDHQIVIADETLGKKKNLGMTWKEKMKKAFFIIFAAYFTMVVAMIPLWFAGAGLLRGFAITTIIGVSVGVLITRPAYAVILEIFTDKSS